MAIGFQQALGVHEQALELRSQRAEILASNLVNADTPNYKARDIDFRAALQTQMTKPVGSVRVAATHDRHIGAANPSLHPGADLMYRMPYQPSLDGNTVEEQEELARFAKNSMDFQASFQLLNGKFKGLKSAIRGE
jgi:flagellar basal-body rod protein FlgB